MAGWGTAFRFARRELRSGLGGFGIFLACLALGVGAIAGVGSLRQSLIEGLQAKGQELLGGDIELRLEQRPAGAPAIDWLKTRGDLSQTIETRAMVRAADSDDSALVELKAVDDAYPLYGAVEIKPPVPLDALLAPGADGLYGAAAEQALMLRLGLAIGDVVRLGDARIRIGAVLVREPDAGNRGLVIGPRLLVSSAALGATGLIREGSLARFYYRLKLPPTVSLAAWRKTLEERFPEAVWRLRDRDNGAPGISRFVDRMGLFLTLAGLTALVVGGVGIANAVTGFLRARQRTIATLKCVGASGGFIFRLYLIQVLLLSAIGIAAGLVLGGVLPALAGPFLAGKLPIDAAIGVHGRSLFLAALYGLFTAIAFTVWPLARARRIAAGSLFRDVVAPVRQRPTIAFMLLAALPVAGLIGLAVLTSGNPVFAGWFVVGAAASFIILRLAAWLVMRAAARIGRRGPRALRMALANLHRPGAATPVVTLSLGLGLTLMVAVALIQGNLAAQIDDRLPEQAPAFFFADIQHDQAQLFDQTTASVAGVARPRRVPMLRGRITHIAGVPVAEATVAAEARWAVRGDRGLTYAATLPDGNSLAAGEWWPADYAGPPLISFDAGLARGMGVGIGDTLTLNILGRPMTATIANLRTINWGTLSLNFAIVFAPGALEAAPHSYLATVKADEAAEEPLQRAVAARLPNVTAIRVRAVLEAINKVLSDIGAAIGGTGAVALLSAVLVLAGAMAAGRRERIYDAVILKVLGATRADLLATFLLEYALLGFVAALIAAVIGTTAAWLVITRIMEANWIFIAPTVLAVVLGATATTVLLGLAGTWRILGHKPARVLRSE